MYESHKSAVQETNNKASLSKYYAVEKKYYDDPYLKYFCKTKKFTTPEMNIGYYVRVESFRSFVFSFISEHPNAQIINVGAGFDTLPFKIMENSFEPQLYVELDLKETVKEKISIIQKTAELNSIFPKQDMSIETLHPAFQYHSSFYHLFPFNLEGDPGRLFQILDKINFNYDIPTLIIAECVFVYLEREIIDNFLKNFIKRVPDLTVINYEQVNMGDTFGQVMVKNFISTGCSLPGLDSCNSKENQIERYQSLGLEHTFCWTIDQVLELLTKECRQRILGIEMVDEPDLMKQLFNHYSIILAGHSEKLSQILSDCLNKYCK